MAASGPYDFACAVLRVDQYHGLGRQSLRRVSSLSGEIAPNGICRVGAGCDRKRAPKKINAPAGVTRRVAGVSAELRGAEVPRSSPPSREGPAAMLGVERPDIEVLDAVFLVHIVQGSALAQRPAQETTGISSGAVRIPPEQLGLCVGGQRGESKQVSHLDPRQRPIGIRTHAAILARSAANEGDDQRRVQRTCRRAATAMGTLLVMGYSREEFIPGAYCRDCGWPFKSSQRNNKRCQVPDACKRRQELPLDQRGYGCRYNDRVHPEWRPQLNQPHQPRQAGGDDTEKYEPLRSYLVGCAGDEELMTFGEMERLVGPLPYSAREYRAWWGNDNKSQALAWRAAGWHVASVDQASGWVVFARGAKGGTSKAGQRTETLRPYVDVQVIATIKAQDSLDRFDRSKLLRLLDELNDNHIRGNGYAVHALLRAVLDHIPPLLGCADFTAAVNNYRWSRTDRAYMRKLLDFKLQADDVLHRQISSKADLLSLDDVPPRTWVNRLLQECTG